MTPSVITCALEAILHKRKIGIREFARTMGVTHVTMISLCKGRSLPRVDLAIAIARRLDMRVEALWRMG